ncbi:hypothetical protein ABW636_09060 [Aquimarina sp. 2201CG1-2-11]|uniref:hypothetical protein n=1 Tax=Aquimarina discodermiae TaxID=3231043 RepID=UPI00346353E4
MKTYSKVNHNRSSKIKLYICILSIYSFCLTGCQKDDSILEESESYLDSDSQSTTISHKSANAAHIYNTSSEAWTAVRQLKQNFGNGVSSLMVITNMLDRPLTRIGKHTFWGRFYNEPPRVIPPGKSAAILGVKTSGSATGFSGYITYNVPTGTPDGGNVYEYFTIGSDVPFIGSNYISGSWNPNFGGPNGSWPIEEDDINRKSFRVRKGFVRVHGKIISDGSSAESKFAIVDRVLHNF